MQIYEDGFISFGSELVDPVPRRQTWPNTEYTATNDEKDPPMVAVYYNNAEMDENGVTTLSHRIVDPTQWSEETMIDASIKYSPFCGATDSPVLDFW